MEQDSMTWLSILNKVYNLNMRSLEEFRASTPPIHQEHVHFLNTEGVSWAKYLPQTRMLVGRNDHVITTNDKDSVLWWGEGFSHQNQKDPDISKGDWWCQNGVLKNKSGSTILIHGIVPRCIIIPFLEWQPGAAKYNQLASDYQSMMEMFKNDFDIEDD